MKLLYAFLILLLTAFTGLEQPFEGEVRYAIAYSNVPNGDAMKQYMPTHMTYQFGKGGAMRFQMDGMMGTDVLVPAGSKEAYIIKEDQKKLYVMDEAMQKKYKDMAGDMKPEVIKTAETETILGYTCTRYNIKMTTKQGEVTNSVWVTDKLKPVRPKYDNQGMFNEKIDGMPLKMSMSSSGMAMTMTADVVTPKQLEASLFVKPAGYTEEPFSPKAMMGK